MLHNSPKMKERRKELRNNATAAEQQLWRVLRCRNIGGHKFRRQHSVGPYILDFYCPARKLALEIDGDSHFLDEAVVYDQVRTAYLHALGITVLRFLNTDVYENAEAVCERILLEVEGNPNHP
ncbi:MAG: endonuclease domain-containing protein [Desulfuromonas sp.]|nr:endonuclease domain-containing protein [Desulfuromonas sp.]